MKFGNLRLTILINVHLSVPLDDDCNFGNPRVSLVEFQTHPLTNAEIGILKMMLFTWMILTNAAILVFKNFMIKLSWMLKTTKIL